ncbi:MAG: aldehyde dehydrogenase family protein [Deltaproteobacteria bacterium]|nr:aldehyde dehydrogenase family protein [Deltaproteobacteria bacterium]
MRTTQVLVAGQLVSTSKQLQVLSPYSGEVVTELHLAGTEELETAVAAAHRAAPVMRHMPTHARAAILERVCKVLEAHTDELTQVLVDEAAKPYRLALGEVRRCVQTFQNAAEECKRLSEGEGVGIDSVEAGEGRVGLIRYFGAGPVLAISPFNFPLNLSAHKVAPAIAAGCPVVLKPASQTPTAGVLLGQYLVEAGLPPEAISVLPAPRAVADALVEDPRFKVLSFTGSPTVGWDLKARAGEKKVVLELGGNAAALVDPSANLEEAVDRLAKGAFAYAGQVCISVQRVYVQREVYPDFLRRLVDYTKAMPAGDPNHRELLVSAMIDGWNAERVVGWVQEAVADGATLHCGGTREGNLVAPTVLSDVPRDAKIAAQEAFGPVVIVAPFDTWEEGLAAVNDSVYGLQAGVFTQDIRRIWQAFEALEVGAVIHNDYPTFRVDQMPYGGVKSSGFGREGLRWSIRDMSEERLLVLRP